MQFWSISKKYIPLHKGDAMKNISLKLEDDIFQETEKIVTKVKKTRNRYINEAVEFYNRLHRRRLLSKQLSKESKIVSKDSMEILAEFEKLNDED
jgi:metal-responsive CopG/Arc/MetJ family transcriptional regulator